MQLLRVRAEPQTDYEIGWWSGTAVRSLNDALRRTVLNGVKVKPALAAEL